MLLNFSACLSECECASVCVCRNFHFVAPVRLLPAPCPLSAHLALSSLYLPRRCLSYFCVTLEFPCPTRTSLCFRFRFRFPYCFCFCFLSFLLLLLPFAELSSSFSIEHVRCLCDFSIHTQLLAVPRFLPPLAAWILPFFRLLCFLPAIFINKFACQMTLFMVFLYERHSHIYLDPRPSSFCHTLLTSLLKYVYMLKLVFCLCRLSSSFTRLALFVCLPES